MNSLAQETKTSFLLKITTDFRNKEISLKKLNEEKIKYFKEFDLVEKDIVEQSKILYKYSENKYTYKVSLPIICNINIEETKNIGYEKGWLIEGKAYYSRAISFENGIMKYNL